MFGLVADLVDGVLIEVFDFFGMAEGFLGLDVAGANGLLRFACTDANERAYRVGRDE